MMVPDSMPKRDGGVACIGKKAWEETNFNKRYVVIEICITLSLLFDVVALFLKNIYEALREREKAIFKKKMMKDTDSSHPRSSDAIS